MSKMSCISCCAACVDGSPTKVDVKPCFALSNMLPAGTVEIDVPTDELCSHIHAEDGWHTFLSASLRPHLVNTEDSQFCDELGYLIQHTFISASYQLNTFRKSISIRIYIIPFDLPNVDGKLLHRPESVLKPARQYLCRLFQMIDKSPEKWEGRSERNARQTVNSHPFISTEPDNRTMAEIYSDLPSPIISTFLDPRSAHIANRILVGSGPDGLITELYGYQRRSVVAMLQRELPNTRIGPAEDSHFVSNPDPLFVPIVGIDGKEFFFQPAKMTILRECPNVAPTRGGIICEELGTGKTLMILTLILATLNDLPTPEPSIYHTQPPVVMTPLAFRQFPSEFEDERNCLLNARTQFGQGPRIPSLVELLLHNLRVPRRGFQPVILQQHQDALEDRGLYRPLMANTPFYHHHHESVVVDDRPKRSRPEFSPRVMFLTSATLIVVPTNLQGQWYSEIQKHCEDSSIRVLKVTPKTIFPPASALASNFDIVLMTYHRFSAEAAFKDVTLLHSRPICRCPTFKASRVPDCICPRTQGVSPLLQIRWKRLVIDEGHVSSFLMTNLTPFARLLNIERRWIVTGTPTTNLLGLSFGHSSELEVNDDDELEYYDPESYTIRSVSTGTSNSDEDLVPRKWTKYDREDLRKLDNMATHFVGFSRFRAEPKVFSDYVTSALFGPHQLPLPGAIQVLNQVMQSLMIRHRIEDVEQDIVLPPITHETVLLDLDPYAIKAYNAMQAAIAINAIDSERKDQDYLFHPRNAELLKLTVENMGQLMFWAVDDKLYNVDGLTKNASEMVQNAIKRNIPQRDMSLLQDALYHVRVASEDRLWRSMMQSHQDVPFRVYNMEKPIFEVWTRTPGSEPSIFNPPTGFMQPDRLLKMRSHVFARPLISPAALIGCGRTVVEEESEQRHLYHESLKSPKKKSDRRSNNKDNTPQSKATQWAKSGGGAETLQEAKRELSAVMKERDGVSNCPPSTPRADVASLTLLRTSCLVRVRVGSSCSTKLNYILNEVLQYGPTEKFLVFSNSPLTLFHVAEGLKLINVKFLRYTTQVQPRAREQLVTTFETSDTYRVFLMELKHGARGLNLTSASRVIFCEPIWRADVESQAIKRAHRIGQTKPISVKTLAIRSTAEENMMARREVFKGKDDRLPKLTDDAGMRQYIANPTFMNNKPMLLSTLDIPFIDTSQTEIDSVDELAATVGVIADGTRTPPRRVEFTLEAVDSSTEPMTPTRRRRVGFADNISGDGSLGFSPDAEGSAIAENMIESPRKKKKLARFLE